ncbi:DUF4157 domain-containing protein [Flavobacterium sp. CLA17]|uniref:eCIS core domain-containing protein n=1 Tax=Flavobacterium sp. CLA17 TaxID=2724135 RepID=UPI0014929051|nr:DUF4157 domain-containing protein [Flavobacterium sp. CLA17]QSB25574.1 DUF4157 domain-containing protein [Flavobacterium sp. CLA17]
MKYAKDKTETKQLTSSVGNLKGNKAIELEDNRSASIQRKSNNTGLPDALKNGMESLSNKNLDHVKVHYNSSKPATVQALAYAQGSNIHLAPGQEKHLPHELGHVVQQMEGRVKPTMKVGGTPVNNDPALESEATHMGQRAIQRASISRPKENAKTIQPKKIQEDHTVQFQNMDHLGVPGINYAVMSQEGYGKWQETVQAKAMSGVSHAGNQVVVTQFQNSDEVQQYFLGSTAVSVFLLLEGSLSVAAGIATLKLSKDGFTPGLIAILVGSEKIIRSLLTYFSGEEAGPFHKIGMNLLRMIEATTALVGASLTVNPLGLAFSITKILRSVMHFVSDFLDKTKYTGGQKAATILAAALHAIEVLITYGSGGIDLHNGIHGGNALKTVTGSLSLGVASSKGVRTADQSHKAYKKYKTPKIGQLEDAQIQKPKQTEETGLLP